MDSNFLKCARAGIMKYKRQILDWTASKALLALTVMSSLIAVFMAGGLLWRSRQILASHSLWELLFSSAWRPLKGQFGFFPFIMGSLWVTGVAIAIAVPISLLSAIYLAEYSHSRIREIMKPLIDLLAGIPSIVYGVCGILVVVPFIKDYAAPFFGARTSGYCVLAAAIVLAVMVLPIIIHVCLEVISTVPAEVKEASLSLGATKWETVKHVVLRKALPGLVAAVVLGISRAFGETMAVLMVAGNVVRVPKSVFDSAYPLPALIANNYGEMLSVPLYDSALLFSSLTLLLVVLCFNIISQAILLRIERGQQ
jgi:phosphate transport system permease protein